MKLFWTILAILYALSPVDLLPEALFGAWGWLDDLIISRGSEGQVRFLGTCLEIKNLQPFAFARLGNGD